MFNLDDVSLDLNRMTITEAVFAVLSLHYATLNDKLKNVQHYGKTITGVSPYGFQVTDLKNSTHVCVSKNLV